MHLLTYPYANKARPGRTLSRILIEGCERGRIRVWSAGPFGTEEQTTIARLYSTGPSLLHLHSLRGVNAVCQLAGCLIAYAKVVDAKDGGGACLRKRGGGRRAVSDFRMPWRSSML